MPVEGSGRPGTDLTEVPRRKPQKEKEKPAIELTVEDAPASRGVTGVTAAVEMQGGRRPGKRRSVPAHPKV
jgi:hypothetical protein